MEMTVLQIVNYVIDNFGKVTHLYHCKSSDYILYRQLL